MTLCLACSGISLEGLQHGYQHLPNAQALRKSSETCALCRLISLSFHRDTLLLIGGEFEVRDHYLNIAPKPMILYGDFAPGHHNDEASSDSDLLRLTGIEVHKPVVNNRMKGTVLVVCKEAITASEECSAFICGRSALQSTNSQRAFDLIASWLQTCISSHPRCAGRGAPNDDEPILPTRVLDVSEDKVRLKISNGRRARYVALSHCWGRNPPLMTSKSNMEAHVKSIKFADMPQTFQDAAIVTRSLGYQYIWIDSLCIVQDDKADWAREALRMSTVYVDADFTLAATGGSSSLDGLFFTRPPLPDTVPFSIRHGKNQISAVAAIPPEASVAELPFNPLADRGWVTQEWLLSRRTVHFGRGDLRWACRSLCETEMAQEFSDTARTRQIHEAVDELIREKALATPDGQSLHRSQSESSSTTPDFIEAWLDVLTMYCRRQLTYVSDKVVAFQGIMDSLSQKIGHPCHYAVWPFSIHQQLSWFASSTLSRPSELSQVPTWSCLSTYGKVQYHTPTQSGQLPFDDLTRTAANFRFFDCALRLYTRVFEYGSLQGPFTLETPNEGETNNMKTRSNIIAHQEKQNVFIRTAELSLGSVLTEHFFGIRDLQDVPIGWASMDEGNVPLKNLLCAQISQYEDDGIMQSSFVLLQVSTKREGTWERVGMGALFDLQILEQATWTELAIV